jgi:hypothetical protein
MLIILLVRPAQHTLVHVLLAIKLIILVTLVQQVFLENQMELSVLNVLV